MYHIGFGADDLPDGTVDRPPLRRSRPLRADRRATHLADGPCSPATAVSTRSLARLPGGAPVVCATSGMGAPSMSIVVNELVQTGIRTVIRVGTAGSIQDHVARRIGGDRLWARWPTRAPPTTSPRRSSRPSPTRSSPSPSPPPPIALGVDHHVGVMASTDTFFEGQERSASSANPHLLRRLQGMIDEYAALGVLNFEMEAGTLFKMGLVYGFAAGCVCGIIAARSEDERPAARGEGRRRRPGDPGRRRRRRRLVVPLLRARTPTDRHQSDGQWVRQSMVSAASTRSLCGVEVACRRRAGVERRGSSRGESLAGVAGQVARLRVPQRGESHRVGVLVEDPAD